MSAKLIMFKTLFIVLITISVYSGSFELTIALSTFTLLLLLIDNNITLNKPFFNVLSPLIIIVLIAFVGVFSFQKEFYFVIKDFFYLTKPILFLLIGYLICKRLNDLEKFLRIIVYIGVGFALFHCFEFIVFYNDFENFSIANLRGKIGKDNFLELVALSIVIADRKYKRLNLSYSRIIVFILSLSFILYFSRTMFILLVVMGLAFLGYLRISKKGLRYIFMSLIGLIVLYTYLFTADIRRDSNSPIENFLYKLKIAPAEIFIADKNFDIRNHANLWDHWRAYEVTKAIELLNENGPLAWTFGTGMGSLVDLDFYAPLSEDPKGMRYISNLHNGYGFVLYKAGIIGLILYLLFLFGNYLNHKIVVKHNEMVGNMILGITLFYFCSSLIISGVFNLSDPLTLVLGGLSFFNKDFWIKL